MKKILFLWLPVIVWSGAIFYLSSIPNLRVTPDTFWDFIWRKIAHLTEYFILYLLLYRAIKKIWLALFLCGLYALSDEWHQSFVPTRNGNERDLLIDFSGSFSGLLFLKLRTK